MAETIYSELTKEFNHGRTRAILSSGQAVVLHKLAVMSKDGDWILQEDEESLAHILSTLAKRNARYRFGAPLDIRWLQNGWSSHFEFVHKELRVRTDFVTRPPRISEQDRQEFWLNSQQLELPFVNEVILAKLKRTLREKDYPVIGELARKMNLVEQQLLHSRSARDIVELLNKHSHLKTDLSKQRPLLREAEQGIEAVERALDQERRAFIKQDEARLHAYANAANKWSQAWLEITTKVSRLSLLEAHKIITKEAEKVLPFMVEWNYG